MGPIELTESPELAALRAELGAVTQEIAETPAGKRRVELLGLVSAEAEACAMVDIMRARGYVAHSPESGRVALRAIKRKYDQYAL